VDEAGQPGRTPQTGWTDTVFEDHDEAGNVIGISRTWEFDPATNLWMPPTP